MKNESTFDIGLPFKDFLNDVFPQYKLKEEFEKSIGDPNGFRGEECPEVE